MNNIRQTKTLAELEKYRNQLLDKLELAVVALDKDYISENSFQSFRVIWQIAIDVSKEQRITLISIQNNLAKQQKANP